MAKQREAIARLSADDRKLQAGLKRASKGWSKFQKGVRAGFGRMVSGLPGKLAGLGIGIGLADAFQEARDFEDQLQRLGSQARFTVGQQDALRDSINETSTATGIGRDKILGGLAAVVDLQGGAAATKSTLETMTQAMLATGASSEDLAGLMFALTSNLGATEESMKGMLGIIDAIGAEASIPFSQLSTELAALTGQAKSFGITGTQGTADLVAAMQVLRTRFKGTAEVATGLKSAMDSFIRKEKQLKKFGIAVHEPTGELRNMFDIIEDIGKSKALGKKGLINVLGSSEATRAVEGLVDEMGEFQRLSALGMGKQDFIDVRAAERANSEIGRIDRSMNSIKQAVAEAFTPERIQDFADVLSDVTVAAKSTFDMLSAIWGITKKLAGDSFDAAKFRHEAVERFGTPKGLAIAEEHERTGSGLTLDAFMRKRSRQGLTNLFGGGEQATRLASRLTTLTGPAPAARAPGPGGGGAETDPAVRAVVAEMRALTAAIRSGRPIQVQSALRVDGAKVATAIANNKDQRVRP